MRQRDLSIRLGISLATAVLLCVVASSCGASAPNKTAGVTLPQPETKIDGELDSDSYPGEPDNDNNHVFGPVASAAGSRAASALVKRYYVAAARGDGAAACRLMHSALAESIAEDYGDSSESPYMRGTSCAQVLSGLFAHMHRGLIVQSATLKVAAVRVRGNYASVRIGFAKARPKFYLELRRERGAWRIDRMLANEQPLYVE